MMYLLDTNIVSERRKRRPEPELVAWLKATEETELHLSAVTIGEIQAGIELTRNARDFARFNVQVLNPFD